MTLALPLLIYRSSVNDTSCRVSPWNIARHFFVVRRVYRCEFNCIQAILRDRTKIARATEFLVSPPSIFGPIDHVRLNYQKKNWQDLHATNIFNEKMVSMKSLSIYYRSLFTRDVRESRRYFVEFAIYARESIIIINDWIPKPTWSGRLPSLLSE